MRILFVTNNYTPYSGGVVSSIVSTTEQLFKQGHDVQIVSLDFLGGHSDDPEHVRRIACPIRFLYKNNHMAVPWRPTDMLMKLIKEYRPDIVHVHHPFLLGLSGLNAARSYGVPCVFTYHTLYEHYAHYVPVPVLCSRPIVSWAARRFSMAVDGIVAPSSAIKNQLRSQGVISPIEVIPSALRTPFISGGNKFLSVEKFFFDLLVVSRFVPEKNIPFVFQVFKLLSDCVKLTLVGYGCGYEKMQRLAFDTMGLSRDRVRFVHKPSQDELIALYRSANLFLFPSQTDTQGIVMVEAMSQGLPVIALDGPGQRDIIQDGINGFIVENADHAVSVINDLVFNSKLHDQLILGAFATAQNYFPGPIIKQLLDFYHQVQC